MDPGVPAGSGRTSKAVSPHHTEPSNPTRSAPRPAGYGHFGAGSSGEPSYVPGTTRGRTTPRRTSNTFADIDPITETHSGTTEIRHRTNYFLLPFRLVKRLWSVINDGKRRLLWKWQSLSSRLGLFWSWAIPLTMNIAVWSAILKFTNCPLVTLWPNSLITELVIPFGIEIKSSNEPSACYGHAAFLTLIALIILLFRVTWAALRLLGMPTVRQARVGVRNWGWHRSMQSFIIIFAGWRLYNYYSIFSEMASNARWSYVQCLRYLFHPLALRNFQKKYCPRVELVLNYDLYFPLCATDTLGQYNRTSELIKLPWTQESLMYGHFAITEELVESWANSELPLTVVFWIMIGGIYFHFFDFTQYIYTELPRKFLDAALTSKPRIFTFCSFQVLRFIFNVYPRFLIDVPSLICRLIQYPFRNLMRDKRTITQYICGVVIYLGLISCWEIWVFLYFIPPRYEWEAQDSFKIFKSAVYFIGTVAYSLNFLIWYQEWSRNVMWPDQKSSAINIQTVRGAKIEEFRRLLRYWDGFWRLDEKKRRRSSREYLTGFNLSDDFCKLLWYPSYVVVYGWYILCTVKVMFFLAQVEFGLQVMFTVTWNELIWLVLAPICFCWVLDDTFFGVGKLDKFSFIIPTDDDLETF